MAIVFEKNEEKNLKYKRISRRNYAKRDKEKRCLSLSVIHND